MQIDIDPKMLGIRGDQTAFYTYFNLAYYGLVRHAVEHGFEAISYGPEAYEAKALRGCTLHPRDSFVLVPQPWRPTVSQLAGLLDRRYAARMAAAPWIFGPAGRASGAG